MALQWRHISAVRSQTIGNSMFVQANIKENNNDLNYRPFVRRGDW